MTVWQLTKRFMDQVQEKKSSCVSKKWYSEFKITVFK